MPKSIPKSPSQSTKFIWMIENFSSLNNKQTHYSDRFMAGGYKWSLMIYPKKLHGNLEMHLVPQGSDKKQPYAEYNLAIFNQKDQKQTVRREAKRLFTDGQGWGISNMIRLSDLHDPDKGFIVDDTCIVQLEITVSWPYNDSDIKVASSSQMVISETKVYPNAGKPFRMDQGVMFCDESQEIVGGFTVLRRHASLYRKIWSKFGHIASTRVFPAESYNSLVTLVTDIMNTVVDMYRCRYIDVSAELINTWWRKIKLAEKLEFNISWLIMRYNDVNKDYQSGQIEKLRKEEEDKEGPTPLAQVKNEPVDDMQESLPGFLFEGIL